MKVLVISDSHGNVANLKHVIGFVKRIGIGAIIHCGDWDTVESVEVVIASGIPLYTVLGNADVREDVIQELKVKSEKFTEDYLEVGLGNKKVGVIHDISFIPKVDVLFCGHTHQQYESIIDGLEVVNPGALEQGINFAIYDTESGKIELIKNG